MSRQLEFKRRVHLPPDSALEPAVSRRNNPAYVGALAWLALTFGCYFLIQRALVRHRTDRDAAIASYVQSARNRPERSVAAALPAEPATAEPAPEPAPTLELALPPPILEADPEPEPGLEAALTPEVAPRPAPAPRASVALLPRPERPKRQRIQSNMRSPFGLDDFGELEPYERRESPRPPRAPLSESDPLNMLWAERSDEPSSSARSKPEPPPEAPTEPEPSRPISAGTSCEAAVARYNEELDMRQPNRTPDISAETYSAILNNGAYLTPCGVPDKMRVRICAAVQSGRAIGVTVTTNPGSSKVAGCVANAVRRLRFPTHPKLDVTHTEFAP